MTSIGYEAFLGCTSLTSVTIPDSVTSIGINAFLDCKEIKILGFANSAVKTYAKKTEMNFALWVTRTATACTGLTTTQCLKRRFTVSRQIRQPPGEVGDVNCDGAVDAFDAIQIDLFLHNVTDIHGNKIA